jgi:hypothetical protein
MTIEASLTVDTAGPVIRGEKVHRSNQTLSRIIGRATDVEFLTVLFQRASDGEWGPLDSLAIAKTYAKMVCGAIGGTLPEFAAVGDGEFSITVDGVAMNITGLDFSGLDSVADVPGFMTCGAIGGTLPEFAAVSDGQFGIAFDGNAAINITCDFSGVDSAADTPGFMTCGAIGATLPELAAVSDGQFGIAFDGNPVINITCDFSGIDAIDDTPGYWTCGANGTNIAGYVALTDAAFSYVVDGVAGDTGPMNLTTCVTFADVVQKINYHLNGEATMLYGWNTDVFKLVSNKTGETSSVTIGAPAAGTDISAAGFLNQAAGSATAGTGGENLGQTPTSIINAELAGRGSCFFDGNAFVFISRTAGETSSVAVLTAGAGGTDISGAAFLNGLTGVGTPTAGTGGENLGQTLVNIINAELAGRGSCYFDGDAFVFVSPTAGETSAVAVLTAGAGGTDISGAAFLNGLTGVGTPTAGTGGENLNETISGIINAAAAGRFNCFFDGDAFVFISPSSGLPQSAITVLSAVSGGVGTDISGAAFLNGLTGVGTVTAATGESSEAIPAGIYWGNDIPFASIAAADVTEQNVLVGKTVELDESKIVLEGGLDLDDVITETGKTIRKHLSDIGIFARSTEYFQNIQPIA